MVLIARYGEIFLKGKNRRDFEVKLVRNIKKMFGVGVLRKRNRLLVEGGVNVDLRRVFGLISYSPAVAVDFDLDRIKEKIWELIKDKRFETFAVAAKRMGAKLDLNSQEINEKIGEFVLKKSNKKVDLKNPDLVIGIEFIDGKSYIFTETIECFGGLPVGVEGKAWLLIEDKNSILAGLLMMKRGCDIFPVGFEDSDLSLLQQYNPKRLELKKIKSIEELEDELPLVVGNDVDSEKVVFNPLVGFEEDEISKKISIFLLK